MPGTQRVAAPASAAAAPADEQPSALSQFWKVAQNAIILFAVSQLATKFFSGGSNTPSTPSPGASPAAGNAQVPVASQTAQPTHSDLAWPIGSELAMHVFLSTTQNGDVWSRKWTSPARGDRDTGLPHFVWDGITYGNWSETRSIDVNVTFPQTVLNNGSLWADVFLTKDGASPDPSDSKFDPSSVHHVRKLLSRYQPKMRIRKERNLLDSKDEEGGELEQDVEVEKDVIVSHWHSNLTLALVSDNAKVPVASLPLPLHEHIHLIHDPTTKVTLHKPIIFPNDFWHLKSQLVELNSTTPTLPLHVEFQPMSYFKFQMFASMTHGFNEAAKQQGNIGTAELDEIKRMLVETNPYFLALTAAVSILHMLFEMLAFSSDVSHWRQKKELVGVSLRTIVVNVVVQLIIMLYLVDNTAETSWMILFTQGTGVLIEAWKITKAVDIKLVPSGPGSILPYRIDIQDRHVLSEDEKRTQEYDRLAYRYVSYAAIPLLAGYTIYSLLYETHRGWYSFVLSTLTSFVYMFGFAQLIPQLIINYKLKSVAHMPMKAMIYKSLSTVVDDFFAFCIKMPFLHRLACFRDDVVFLIFLYQRWIYRIDPKRVNEYGQVLEGEVLVDGGGDGEKKETKKTK